MTQLVAAVEGLQGARTVEWDGTSWDVTFHLFVNQADENMRLMWVCGLDEKLHGIVEPGSNHYAGTCEFHEWRVRSSNRDLLLRYKGPSATVYIRPDLTCAVVPNQSNQQLQPQSHHSSDAGTYKERGTVLGIPIMAFDCVAQPAVDAAGIMLQYLLHGCPPEVRQRLLDAGAKIGIIGRNQDVTDLPPHQFMRHTVDRDIDRTCRGLGGTRAVPTTSVAEENLLLDDQKYYNQSILVHEFAHAVVNMAMTEAQLHRLEELYCAARTQSRFPLNVYMMTNVQEYWAVGAEAYFGSTTRTDISDGVVTRSALQVRDPGLAALLAEVFGEPPCSFETVRHRIFHARWQGGGEQAP